MPPEELVLRPSRIKTILLLLVCLAFTAIGFTALRSGDLGVGLSCSILFGLGSIIAVIQLFPNASYLKLTTEGFVVCALFRVHPLVPWQQVRGFRVASLPPRGQRMVVYDSLNPARQTLRNINRELVGASDALPDSYGMKHETLAALMNSWREQRTGSR